MGCRRFGEHEGLRSGLASMMVPKSAMAKQNSLDKLNKYLYVDAEFKYRDYLFTTVWRVYG
jgi:hypothetical protein